MALIAQRPARPFTFEDLEAMPDDGYRREVIGGSLVVTPAPSSGHQRVALNLAVALRAVEPPDLVVLIAPCDWLQPDGGNLEPDVMVIERADFDPAGPVAATALPRLVVEVLSPFNRLHDVAVKRALYEARGVPAYWMVDPAGPSLVALRLAGGRYQIEAEMRGEERFYTDLPYPVSLIPALLL